MTDRRRLVTVLVATFFFRSSQNMALTTMSLLGQGNLHLSSAEIGVLGAVAGLTLAATTILVSGRVPLHRSTRSSAFGMLLLSVAILLFSVASNLAEMLLAAAVLGLGGGVAMPGLVNAVEHGTGQRRDRAIGLYTVTLSISLALGPLVESAVLAATSQDLRAPFLAFLALPLIAAVVLVVGNRSLPDPEPRPLARRGTSVGGAAGPPAEGSGPLQAPDRRGRRAPLATLLATVQGRQALLIQLLYAVPFAGLTSFGALVARTGFGVTAAQAQVAFTSFFAASMVARLLTAWRAPITRKRPILWVAIVLTVAGLVTLGLGHGFVALLVAMAILGIPHGFTFPLVLALVAAATEPAQLPQANAALLGSTNLSAVAVPPVLGVLIPAVGYHGMAFLLVAPVVGFATLFARQGDVTGPPP